MKTIKFRQVNTGLFNILILLYILLFAGLVVWIAVGENSILHFINNTPSLMFVAFVAVAITIVPIIAINKVTSQQIEITFDENRLSITGRGAPRHIFYSEIYEIGLNRRQYLPLELIDKQGRLIYLFRETPNSHEGKAKILEQLLLHIPCEQHTRQVKAIGGTYPAFTYTRQNS